MCKGATSATPCAAEAISGTPRATELFRALHVQRSYFGYSTCKRAISGAPRASELFGVLHVQQVEQEAQLGLAGQHGRRSLPLPLRRGSGRRSHRPPGCGGCGGCGGGGAGDEGGGGGGRRVFG
eukprot:scaffold7710_cov101-Isochrysis_galbana.AAC.2